MDSRVRLSLVIGAVVSIAFLWATNVPLGIPGEWEWGRVRIDEDRRFDVLLGCGIACAAAGAYLWLAWLGGNRIGGCSRAERAAWLAGLVAAGFAWLCFVQAAPPKELRSLKPMWVLYDPSASGYFFEACHEMDDVDTFLATYEDRMKQGDVLHVGTHPPGLFLLHRGLITVCRASPGFSDFVLQTQPNSVGEAFRAVERGVRLTPASLTRSEEAALWLAVLLTQFVAAATVVPLYWLLRRDDSPQTSWMCAAFWPLVPALALFLPKSDALYPCLGMLFLWTWLEGWRRGSVPLCLLAGLLLWAGLFCSLALLPVVLLAALLTVWETRIARQWKKGTGPICRDGPKSALHKLDLSPFSVAGKPVVSIGCAAAGFLLPIGWLWAACKLNLFAVWSWNYLNHAAFYGQFQRTYWKWLLVNPLETSLAVGLPLVVLTAASSLRCFGRVHGSSPRRLGPYWACAVVWGLLWLSGKNMGEAARLWLVLMPLPVWLTAGCIEMRSLGSSAVLADLAAMRRARLTGWLPALALQAIVCIATVARVDGFHLDRSQPADTSPAKQTTSGH